MASTVVLHVGTMKSGTSFLQHQLLSQQEDLAAAGVTVLGGSWRAQVRGVREALQPRLGPRWEALVEQARAAPERAILSMEFLGPAAPDRVRRIVASLRPARVEVIVTVRDLNRTLLSMWQETVRNGRSWGLEDYLGGARDRRPDAPPGDVPSPGTGGEAGRTFWRQQDATRIAATWQEAGDRLGVVTVPPPGAGSEVLLGRFVRAAELPDLPVRPAPVAANRSLGAASVLMLRRLNEELARRDVDVRAGLPVLKQVLAKQVLGARRDDEPALGLEIPAWVPTTAAHLIAGLRRLDPPLQGDWRDLEPVPVPGVAAAEVPPDQIAAAAVVGLAGLVEDRIRQGSASGT